MGTGLLSAHAYSGLGCLTADRQEHSGAVDASTPEVSYTCTNGTGGVQRRTTMVLPDGRQLSIEYGAAGSIDDTLNRAASGREAATIQVRVTDTGRHPSLTAAFAEFEEGTTGPVERLRVGLYPAIFLSLGAGGDRLQVLVEGRFLVEYLWKNMGRDGLKPWIEATRFGQFRAVTDGGKWLKRVVEVTRIDELNPARNRTYELSITTSSEIEAIIAEQEQAGGGCR